MLCYASTFFFVLFLGHQRALADCPPDYFRVGADCFFFSGSESEGTPEDLVWVEAMKKCNSRGGFLASFDSKEQLDQLTDLYRLRNDSFYLYWVGMASIEGKWIWASNGQSADKTLGLINTAPKAETNYCMMFNFYIETFIRNKCNQPTRTPFICRHRKRICE